MLKNRSHQLLYTQVEKQKKDIYNNGNKAIREKFDDWYLNTYDKQGHNVRSDALSLLSGIISFPLKGDKEKMDSYLERLRRFEKDII